MKYLYLFGLFVYALQCLPQSLFSMHWPLHRKIQQLPPVEHNVLYWSQSERVRGYFNVIKKPSTILRTLYSRDKHGHTILLAVMDVRPDCYWHNRRYDGVQSILSLLNSGVFKEHNNAVKALLKERDIQGFDVFEEPEASLDLLLQAQDDKGNTILHYAVMHGDKEVIKLLGALIAPEARKPFMLMVNNNFERAQHLMPPDKPYSVAQLLGVSDENETSITRDEFYSCQTVGDVSF